MLAGATLLAPVPATATGAETACRVVSADLRWGVKESFRSYISGSIANGSWTVDNGSAYETPDFLWTSAEGELSDDLGDGELPFTGGIHFTGHDGLLRFDLADPVIEFEDAETAVLTLSIGATDSGATDSGGAAADARSSGADAAGVDTADPDAAEVGEEPLETVRVRAADIDLAGTVTAGGDRLVIDGAVPRLTAEGASAFNGGYGSYVEGEELDPLTVEATVEGCELSAITADRADPEPAESGASAAPQGVPWVPIVVGAVALVVIGVAGALLFAGRHGRAGADTEASADDRGGPTPSR